MPPLNVFRKRPLNVREMQLWNFRKMRPLHVRVSNMSLQATKDFAKLNRKRHFSSFFFKHGQLRIVSQFVKTYSLMIDCRHTSVSLKLKSTSITSILHQSFVLGPSCKVFFFKVSRKILYIRLRVTFNFVRCKLVLNPKLSHQVEIRLMSTTNSSNQFVFAPSSLIS